MHFYLRLYSRPSTPFHDFPSLIGWCRAPTIFSGQSRHKGADQRNVTYLAVLMQVRSVESFADRYPPVPSAESGLSQ